MKKTTPIIFAFASLLLLNSCVVKDYAEYCHTDSYMHTICTDLVSQTVEYSITQFTILQEKGQDINAEGFSSDFESDFGINFSIQRTADNEWNVNGSSSEVEFSMKASRSTAAGEETYKAAWTCSECKIDYTESEKYSMTLSSSGNVLFGWSKVFYAYNASYGYSLYQNAVYDFVSYKDSKSMDYGTLKYLPSDGSSIDVTHAH